MRITEDHRTIHAYVREFGPITTRLLAHYVGLKGGQVAGRVASLVADGHVTPSEEWVQQRGKWVRQWEVGPVSLPAAEPKPVLVVVPLTPPRPEVPRQTVAQVQAVFDRAKAEGLKPAQDADRDFRVGVPHPFGLPGSVWLDTMEDLDALLRERRLVRAGKLAGPRREVEEEQRAAA